MKLTRPQRRVFHYRTPPDVEPVNQSDNGTTKAKIVTELKKTGDNGEILERIVNTEYHDLDDDTIAQMQRQGAVIQQAPEGRATMKVNTTVSGNDGTQAYEPGVLETSSEHAGFLFKHGFATPADEAATKLLEHLKETGELEPPQTDEGTVQ